MKKHGQADEWMRWTRALRRVERAWRRARYFGGPGPREADLRRVERLGGWPGE